MLLLRFLCAVLQSRSEKGFLDEHVGMLVSNHLTIQILVLHCKGKIRTYTVTRALVHRRSSLTLTVRWLLKCELLLSKKIQNSMTNLLDSRLGKSSHALKHRRYHRRSQPLKQHCENKTKVKVAAGTMFSFLRHFQ